MFLIKCSVSVSALSKLKQTISYYLAESSFSCNIMAGYVMAVLVFSPNNR